MYLSKLIDEFDLVFPHVYEREQIIRKVELELSQYQDRQDWDGQYACEYPVVDFSHFWDAPPGTQLELFEYE